MGDQRLEQVNLALLVNDWIDPEDGGFGYLKKLKKPKDKSLLETVGTFVQYTKVNLYKPSIDDIIFKMHYRATTILLLASVILVTQRQYIGEHIKCLNDLGVPENVINTYCFFSSTFTVAKHYNETGLEHSYIPHPGVGPAVDEDEVVRHAYYQWVPFVLFLQAMSFYLPHYIWRSSEGGRLAALVSGLRTVFQPYKDDQTVNGVVVVSEVNLKKKIEVLKAEFISRLHVSHKWSRKLVMCEVLNLVNLMIQVHLTNVFLGYAFMDLGPRVAAFDNWDGYQDPLDVVFPKVTKCTFYKYGPSGSIQNHDALCVMALNVIHEKIFAILWFWYLILFILTCLGLIFRLVIFIMHSRSSRFNEFMFAYACPGNLDIKDIASVTNRCYFGDWLFLYFLAKNMSPYTFKNLFVALAENLESKPREIAVEDEESMVKDIPISEKDIPMSEKDIPYSENEIPLLIQKISD